VQLYTDNRTQTTGGRTAFRDLAGRLLFKHAAELRKSLVALRVECDIVDEDRATFEKDEARQPYWSARLDIERGIDQLESLAMHLRQQPEEGDIW
jgi:hypothetical protein